MELAPVPRRRLWPRPVWVVLVIIVLAPVTVLALLPTAFGLERYVICEDAATSAVARGSVVFEQRVPAGDIAPGDVVTYRADPAELTPGGTQTGFAPDQDDASTPARVLLTRHVIGLEQGDLIVRIDENDSSGTVRVDLGGEPTMSRVVLAVPFVGYPFLAAVSRPVWGVLFLGLGLLLGLASLRPRRRARGARRAGAPVGMDPRNRRDRRLAA